MSIRTIADRRGSRRSNLGLTAAMPFDALEQGLLAGVGGYQSQSRCLHSSSLPFQPEDTISIIALLVRGRRFEAQPVPGTPNSPILEPPDFASVLSGILRKALGYGHRTRSGAGGNVRLSRRREQALILNPPDSPHDRNGISIGRGPLRQSGWEGGHTNASQI